MSEERDPNLILKLLIAGTVLIPLTMIVTNDLFLGSVMFLSAILIIVLYPVFYSMAKIKQFFIKPPEEVKMISRETNRTWIGTHPEADMSPKEAAIEFTDLASRTIDNYKERKEKSETDPEPGPDPEPEPPEPDTPTLPSEETMDPELEEINRRWEEEKDSIYES
jgi:hypothetical protein